MSFKSVLSLSLLGMILIRCDIPQYATPLVFPVDHEPRFSPDGTRVLFVRDFDHTNPCGLYVVNSDGTDERVVVDAICGDWAPDGRTLAVRRGLGVWIVDVDSGYPIKLVHNARDLFGYIDWSPDGRWITYSVAGASGGVIRIEVETGQTKLIAPRSVRGVRWSEDSRRVVYEADGGIWVSDSAGIAAKVVLRNDKRFSFRRPCWLGASIVCQYGYSDDLEAATGLAQAETTGSWRPLNLNGVDPDGHSCSRRIAYSAFMPDRNVGAVFAVNSDGSDNAQLTRR